MNYMKDPNTVRKVSELVRMADYWFRQYLISKTNSAFKAQGLYICPFRRVLVPLNDLHVCHFIDRRVSITKYSTDNCVLCSAASNTFDAQKPATGYRSQHHKDFALFLGEEKVVELKKLAETTLILHRDDYIELINKFKQLINESN